MTKDLLRAFGKASAMTAFPSDQKIEISIVADQWWNAYVAPMDGFVYVEGNTLKNEANASVAELSGHLGSHSANPYGCSRAYIAVRKGLLVEIAARGEKGVSAWFIPAKAST